MTQGTSRAAERGQGEVPLKRLTPWTALAAGRLPQLSPWDPHAAGERYDVLGCLHSGAYWITLLGYSAGTRSLVILRTPSDHFVAVPSVSQQLVAQGHLLAELRPHPNVVPTWFCERIRDRMWLLGEFVAGDERGLSTLAGRLRQGPISAAVVSRWARELCAGLAHLAASGLAPHLELTPSTIYLGYDGSLRIAHAGLSRVILAGLEDAPLTHVERHGRRAGQGSTQGPGASPVTGTPTHMAPEQLIDGRACDERSDVYAVGVILYQLVSGSLPFLAPPPRDDSEAEARRYIDDLLYQHTEAALVPLDTPLWPVIARCLAKDPEARYPAAAAVSEALDSVIPPTAWMDDETAEARAHVNRGLGLHAVSQLDGALEAFADALAVDPEDAAAWRHRATCLHDLGRYEEAMDAAEEALRLDPELGMAKLTQALLSRAVQRRREALARIEEAVALSPDEPLFWLVKGRLLQELGRPGEANPCYRTALDRAPRHAHLWALVARGLRRQGRADDAVRCLERAVAIDPAEPGAWVELGAALELAGRSAEALSCFERATRLDPTSHAAWYRLGRSAEQMARRDLSVTAYERFLEHVPPHYPDLVEAVSERLAPRETPAAPAQQSPRPAATEVAPARVVAPAAESGEPGDEPGDEHADEHADELGDQIDPREVVTAVGDPSPAECSEELDAGLAAARAGRLADTVRLLEAAVAADDGDARAWAELGYARMQEGEGHQSFRCVAKVVDLEPQDAAVWLRLGDTLLGLERFKTSETCYAKAARLDPKSAPARIGQALAISGKSPAYMLPDKRLRDLIRHLDGAAQIDTDPGRAAFARGLARRAEGRVEEALRWFDRAVEPFRDGLEGAGPRDAPAPTADQKLMSARMWREHASALVEAGDVERAERSLARARDGAPEDPKVWSLAAVIERKRGNYPAALEHLERAKELAPNDEQVTLQRGLVALAQERYEDALDAFESVLERTVVADPMFYYHRARSEEALGDYAAAQHSLLSFCEKAPPPLQRLVEEAQVHLDLLEKQARQRR